MDICIYIYIHTIDIDGRCGYKYSYGCNVHVNTVESIRALHFGSKAQEKGDSRNQGLQDVAFWAPIGVYNEGVQFSFKSTSSPATTSYSARCFRIIKISTMSASIPLNST